MFTCPDHIVDCGSWDLHFAASKRDLYLFDHRPETEKPEGKVCVLCLIVPPPASTFLNLPTHAAPAGKDPISQQLKMEGK
jgi:hypothetical protein